MTEQTKEALFFTVGLFFGGVFMLSALLALLRYAADQQRKLRAQEWEDRLATNPDLHESLRQMRDGETVPATTVSEEEWAEYNRPEGDVE